MKDSERIYIGGIEPPHLTTQEVLDRLKASLNDVQVEECREGTSFLHLSAISNSQECTALEAITKLFNNVRWKGCRLKVESARPHFLQRLAQERQERSLLLSQSPMEKESFLPRHLRVREKGGKEASRIDTKPFLVSDWDTFARQRNRFTGRNVPRAVHLRFGDDFVPEFLADSESETEDSSMESSSTESTGSGESKRHVGSRYVWSDDDDDDEGGDDDEKTSSGPSKAKLGYLESNVNELSEFAAAMDHESEDDSTSVGELGCEKQRLRDDPSATNIENDVQSNLLVLSHLFPDQKFVPSKPTDEQKQKQAVGWASTGQMLRYDPTKASAEQFVIGIDDETTVSHHSVNSASSQINTDVMGDGDCREVVVGEADAVEGGTADDGKEVYHQGKLEQVFRDARDDEVADQSVNVNGSIFAFSFDLGASSAPIDALANEAEKSFTFSFPVDEEASADRSDEVDLQQDGSPPRLPPRTLFFSDGELDRFVDEFYNYKEGARIINDLTRFRNDPHVREAWKKERAALTQDWKRKRKYAVSRSQSKRQR